MGKPYDEVWGELGDSLEPAFRRAEIGLPTQGDDACFFIERKHLFEEIYTSFNLIPLHMDNVGLAIYNPVLETTRKVITDRRMKFLLEVSAKLAGSKDPGEFWVSLQQAMDRSPHEVPFALMFSARKSLDEDRSTSEQNITRESWVLEGNLGYTKDTLAAIPTQFASDPDTTNDFIPQFDNLIHQSEPTMLRRSDGSLPEKLIKNVQSRAFGDRVEAALLIPIHSTGDHVSGFLLLGLDPRRPWDDEYSQFIQLLARQLATSMAQAVLLEDETRASRIANTDRVKQTELALEAEQRFRRMADLAPVGMFQFDSTGLPIYCNDMWYSITEYPRGAEYPMCWYNVLHPDDQGVMDEQWAKLSAGAAVSFELRLRKPFSAAEIVGGEKVEGDTWILAAAYSQTHEDGTVSSILGCVTDISHQKWAEDFQNRRKNEAVELKRQQESFIDMTSHEMRKYVGKHSTPSSGTFVWS